MNDEVQVISAEETALEKPKTEETRQEIAKRAGETRRKNNAEKSRFERAMVFALNKKNGKKTNLQNICNNLVDMASNLQNTNAIEAAKFIRDIIGESPSDKANINISNDNNQVQIIFTGDSRNLAK